MIAVRSALAEIETAIEARRADQARIATELESLEAAAGALRRLSPLPGEREKATRMVRRPVAVAASEPEPCLAPAVATDAPSGPLADDPGNRYPDVARRRQRVLGGLSVRVETRCAELARRLDIAQSHVQTDLEWLAAKGLAERVSWGTWRRAAVEDVVFQGRDSLLPEASEATRQRA